MPGMLLGYREKNTEHMWISKPTTLTQRNITPSTFRNSCGNYSIPLLS